MKFSRYLKQTAEQSIVSAGYDPAPQSFPQENVSGYDPELPDPASSYSGEEVKQTIISYFKEFAEVMKQENVSPGAFKPNLGYFIMYDTEEQRYGTEALNTVLQEMKDVADVPVILDAKDGDIGRSSAAYAVSKLKMENVDAVTVHSYMGTDSVEPFLRYADRNGQGVYVLTRTTNPGAEEFQELKAGGKPVYMHVAEKIVEWSQKYPGTVGSVAAGNNTPELKQIASKFAEADADIPLLIPGVGSQGGKAEKAVKTLKETGYDPKLARINSSSGIMYRAQKDNRGREKHAEASLEELKRLNSATDI